MTLYIVLTIIGIIVVGAVNQILKIKEISDNIDYLNEYSSNFNNFVSKAFKNESFDSKEYAWLVSKTDKMQILLGGIGIVDYQYLGVSYRNIAILLNFISALPGIKNNIFVDMQEMVAQAQWCQNSLIRLGSSYETLFNNERKKIFNPIHCFTNGVRFIISIPIYILNSIGLLSINSTQKIISSIFMKIIGGLLSLITIVSGLVTIVVGWEEFIKFFSDFK